MHLSAAWVQNNFFNDSIPYTFMLNYGAMPYKRSFLSYTVRRHISLLLLIENDELPRHQALFLAPSPEKPPYIALSPSLRSGTLIRVVVLSAIAPLSLKLKKANIDGLNVFDDLSVFAPLSP
jgi:hypothetical protein